MRNIMKRVKAVIDIAFLLILLILACGCQQTPEKTAVVYRGGLEEKLKGPPAPFGAYDAPANWQETLNIKGSNTKVEIDASISVPDVTAFPVYKVKQTEFDDKRVKALVDYFTKGRDVIKDTGPAKADLEKELILAKQYNDEEMIAELERMIAIAPEIVDAEVITDWSADKSPAGSFLAEDGEYAQIDVSSNRFWYRKKGFILSDSILSLSDKDKIKKADIPEEGAIEVAQNMLHELGIDYMAPGKLENAQLYSSVEDAFVEPVEEPLSRGYLIKFVRSIDGIAGLVNHSIMYGMNDDFAYRAPLYPEEIHVYVDDLGNAQSFAWNNPLEVEEKVTENASLLPFEDIKQRIRDMLTFINANNDLLPKVTSIELNIAIIDVKDHPGEAMYVPAWFVYYAETFYDLETGEDEQQIFRLGLNAIDGGRVMEVPVNISPEMQKEIDEQREK